MKYPQTPSQKQIIKRQGAYLPHWTSDGAIYSVTFRLADSLPQSVLQLWLKERSEIVQRAKQFNRTMSPAEEKRLRALHSDRVESYLDAGHGACWLNNPKCAELVADALKYFHDQRYKLHAWCLMPNHVHTIVQPLGDWKLPVILHSWKSYTAKAANRLLCVEGSFWQEEYYDHLNRDDQDYAHALEYLLNNPKTAGLINWPWIWWHGQP